MLLIPTSDLITSFTLGLVTPLTAVCVLPLYPGFLSYLASKLHSNLASESTIAKLGGMVALGVITFMFLLGLIFTTILQTSLTNVISIVSPIAFGILGIVSIFLIYDIDLNKIMPKIKIPKVKNPIANAFVFGFFFGAIVIPCNPLFIAALFTKVLSSTTGLVEGMSNFLMFGLGMSFPLLFLAFASATIYKPLIKFLTKNKRYINTTSGLIMLGISFYYLFFVFHIFG